jgi:thiamine kinase-like enzyme
MSQSYKENWQDYRDKELKKVEPILREFGFFLDSEQVHIGGERYLSGGKKLVLIGHRELDSKKVIIKISSDEAMRQEIRQEWKSRKILKKINFAYHIFYSPAEIFFIEQDGYTVFVTEFIEQESTFLDRPLQEQFFIALKAFEAQEAIHATTYEHSSAIEKYFGIWDSHTYKTNLKKYISGIKEKLGDKKDLNNFLDDASKFINQNLKTIDLYCNFLTHWDFVPHNFRVSGNDIYLLDHSSIRFGNKYESWARFLNFMILYNQDLEKLLLNYVKENRDHREYLSLRAMRVFRLTELIWHYVKTLDQAQGDLKTLNKKRIDLWTNALEAVLADQNLDISIVEGYKSVRDSLRDEEEKLRQTNLH